MAAATVLRSTGVDKRQRGWRRVLTVYTESDGGGGSGGDGGSPIYSGVVGEAVEGGGDGRHHMAMRWEGVPGPTKRRPGMARPRRAQAGGLLCRATITKQGRLGRRHVGLGYSNGRRRRIRFEIKI
jgi:hypothetical protein